MAQVSTGATGFGGFLSGLADVIGAAAPIVGQFVGRPVSLPGGSFVPAGQTGIIADPAMAQLDLGPLFGGGGLSATPQGGTMALLGSPFRPTMAGAASKTFVIPNPVTGKATWFRPAGRPILWSGDLTVCKRVKRVARRARRAGG